MKPTKAALGIPDVREIQARLSRWLRFFVDTESKTGVANSTGMSVSHITNLYNHPDRHRPSLEFLICVVWGMDASPRELLREEPETHKRAARPTPAPKPQAGRSNKRASKA